MPDRPPLPASAVAEGLARENAARKPEWRVGFERLDVKPVWNDILPADAVPIVDMSVFTFGEVVAVAIHENVAETIVYAVNNCAAIDRMRERDALIAEMATALGNTFSLLKAFTSRNDDVARAIWDEAEAALAKARG